MRRPLTLLLIGTAAMAVAIGFAGYVPGVRVTADRSATPAPAHIVPLTWVDGAVLQTFSQPDAHPPGIEGALLFIRLADAHGRVILDRQFSWPSDRQAIPPGTYALTAYWRRCNGNCDNLGGEAPFCELSVRAGPLTLLRVEVFPSDLALGSTCALAP
jgi:hypothetical protein